MKDSVKMMEIVHHQISPAVVLLTGKETSATWVILPTMSITTVIFVYCTLAVCAAGFCENGGSCLHPNTNCSCISGWSGDRCQQGKCKLVVLQCT